MNFKNLIATHPATLLYILLIIIINNLFIYAPSLKVYDSEFSCADIVVGVVYILRDFSQREIGNKIIFAMLLGCFFSYVLADKSVAFDSVISFLVGEVLDWAIYTYTKKPLSQRLLLSSLISTPIDSVVFLYLMNQLNWLGVSVLTTSKIFGVMCVWGFWKFRNIA